MKRGILFRGKDTDTGRWYEGFYMALSDTTYCFKEDYDRNPDNTKHYIVFDQMTDWCLPNRHLQAEVDPTTVGQYTGLNDKNGKLIFEGDIVRCGTGRICKVIFFTSPCFSGFDLIPIDGFDAPPPRKWSLFSDTEVIGNIHDNNDLGE